MPTTLESRETMTAAAGHHDALGAELVRLTDDLLSAVAARRPHEDARRELVAYARAEVLPHTSAEAELYTGAGLDGAAELLATTMAEQQEELAALVDRLDLADAGDGVAAASAASALMALFLVRAAEEDRVLLPTLAASGVDVASLLGDRPELLGVAGHGPHAVPTVSLDLTGLDHDQARSRLRRALAALDPGEALRLTHGGQMRSLRFEVEATMPQVYRWSLPEDLPGAGRWCTLVERF